MSEVFAEIIQQICQEREAGNSDAQSSTLRPLVFDQREEAVVQEVEQFIATTKEKNPEIVIIYGANHDFSKYFAGQNFTRINMF